MAKSGPTQAPKGTLHPTPTVIGKAGPNSSGPNNGIQKGR
jgi:hypothetical protein